MFILWANESHRPVFSRNEFHRPKPCIMNSINRQVIYNFYARCGSGEINYVFYTIKRTYISRLKEL
jgi:hypothetical protein